MSDRQASYVPPNLSSFINATRKSVGRRDSNGSWNKSRSTENIKIGIFERNSFRNVTLYFIVLFHLFLYVGEY